MAVSRSVDVTLLTQDEMTKAVELTVASTGYTVKQLQKQATRGKFKNKRAQDVWYVLRQVLSKST